MRKKIRSNFEGFSRRVRLDKIRTTKGVRLSKKDTVIAGSKSRARN